MIDAHVHIEFGEYSPAYVDRIVEEAQSQGVTELWILDHTHKFIDFNSIYDIIRIDRFQKDWYDRKRPIPLVDYIDFIETVRLKKYPIKLLFGLEVCYFEEKEDIIRKIIKPYKFDFLVGSVHFIDGFGYDLSRENWKEKDVNRLYKRYYEITENLIKSRLFTSLGHPDAIKLFEKYPNYSLIETYRRIAFLLKKYNVATENNSGLVRYGFPYPGLNPDLYKILKEANVTINRASDAHRIEDIGRMFNQLKV